MRATELFRALRDESIADHVKVETAHQAWISPEFTFPKQREFLTEWLLGRLLKVKEDSKYDVCLLEARLFAQNPSHSAQAILTSPNTWTLLEHLLSDISVESISGILVKIPTLPILNAFLGRALSIASQANLVEPAARVFRQIVPLAAQRATADAVQSSLEAAYKASLAADQPCQMWHQLLGGSFSDLAAALHLASAAVHKKVSDPKYPCPSLMVLKGFRTAPIYVLREPAPSTHGYPGQVRLAVRPRHCSPSPSSNNLLQRAPITQSTQPCLQAGYRLHGKMAKDSIPS